jgi:hypothetical protein
MNPPHDFRESKQRSHSASDLPIWEEVYRGAFPEMVSMIDHRQDGEHQRAGIDRSIILANSKQLLVDEKVRFKDYGDILIEYISNDRTGAPGWAEKDLRCDYIAYAILPSGKCYLLPVIQLQIAWRKNKPGWLSRYGQRSATNCTYNTINCPVPVDVIFPAMGSAFRVSFAPLITNQKESA